MDRGEFKVQEGLPPVVWMEGGGLETALENRPRRIAIHAGAEAVIVMGAAQSPGEGIRGRGHEDQAGFGGEETVAEEVHSLLLAAFGDELKVEFAFAVDAEQDRVRRRAMDDEMGEAGGDGTGLSGHLAVIVRNRADYSHERWRT